MAVLLALVLLAVAVLLVGRGLPVGHLASRTVTLSVPPQRVWDAIHEVAAAGDLSYEEVEAVPPARLVRRIVGESAFGGTWSYEIAPTGAGSTLTITERGEVYNAFFRFVSRYVLGHHRTIDGYLATLRARLGA